MLLTEFGTPGAGDEGAVANGARVDGRGIFAGANGGADGLAMLD